MSKDARRKERQRLKRKHKRDERRRATSGSPYKLVGRRGQFEACYVNADWRESGLAMVHVLRTNPAGGYAIVTFLIDMWCAGLKGASGRLDALRDDFDEHLARARQDLELVRIEPEQARQLVAGAVRFARQNGFRLPRHYDRWAALLGDLREVTPDLSPFGKDGGLVWVGTLDDLRRRLIASSVEEFLARPDVHYVAGVNAPRDLDAMLEDEDEDDDLDGGEDGNLGELDDAAFQELVDVHVATQRRVATILTEQVAGRCEARLEQPHPRLFDAMRLYLALQTTGELAERPPADVLEAARVTAAATIASDVLGADAVNLKQVPADLDAAMEQARPHLDDLEKNPDGLALGIDDDGGVVGAADFPPALPCRESMS